MHLSTVLSCLNAMASSSAAAINVWLYSLPGYQGDVYRFDGDSHSCSTVGEDVYGNVQSAKIVHFEPFPYFVCSLFSSDDCVLHSELFHLAADGQDIPLTPNFGVRSILCEAWEP
ncbi:uncharacterized protein TrAFT101_003809 [Trichoderma asperellum]|uniref:uncharacterized protein n=1 Tax=Trichoderma asperellum TaxID=101201 RepID=UPI0033215F35|nr:hypothetical protein TrAFT101_003809 [Trichoderma asperellum]